MITPITNMKIFLAAFISILLISFCPLSTGLSPSVTGTFSATNLQGKTISSINETEINSLLYMREEEKMARDLYKEWYRTWKITPFKSIANSEQKHMDSIKVLITQFSLKDPVKSEEGKFTNATIQKLFNELKSKGDESVLSALKSAIIVEETDIHDLNSGISNTSDVNIKRVYNNLRQGSVNHKSTFSSLLNAYTVK